MATKKKSPATKKKSPATKRKSPATKKKSPAKNKYGDKAASKVKRAMHKMHAGTLKSGGSGKKVKSRKQAIAIGLSEARKAGGKVPQRKSSS